MSRSYIKNRQCIFCKGDDRRAKRRNGNVDSLFEHTVDYARRLNKFSCAK